MTTKTTLELPDDLLRLSKMRAVERDQKLMDTISQLLQLGLANRPEDRGLSSKIPEVIAFRSAMIRLTRDYES